MKAQLLTTIALIFLPLFTFGQEQTFVYDRQSGVINLINGPDSIKFHDYTSTENKTRERIVGMDGKKYTLTIAKNKDRIQTITDENGTRYASVSLGTKNRYDIVLDNGSVLECSVTGKTWTYTRDGVHVMTGTVKKENGKKMILINTDLENIPPAALFSALERGTDRYASSSSTGPIIASAVVLALLRAATANNSGPDY